MSPQFKDKRAAFILEIAKTAREENLYDKVEGLLGPCEATAVIVCRTAILQSGRATLELWSRNESEDTQQTSVGREMIWRTDLLNEEGEVPSDQSSTRISLALFITPGSWNRFLSQYTDEEFEPFANLAPLVIDTSMLGHKLKELRSEERGGEGDLGGIHEEHEVEPDVKRKLFETSEAWLKALKTTHQ